MISVDNPMKYVVVTMASDTEFELSIDLKAAAKLSGLECNDVAITVTDSAHNSDETAEIKVEVCLTVTQLEPEVIEF